MFLETRNSRSLSLTSFALPLAVFLTWLGFGQSISFNAVASALLLFSLLGFAGLTLKNRPHLKHGAAWLLVGCSVSFSWALVLAALD